MRKGILILLVVGLLVPSMAPTAFAHHRPDHHNGPSKGGPTAPESPSEPSPSPDENPTEPSPEPPDTSSNSDFYVSPSGTDSNPGTQERPLRTISKAVELASASGKESKISVAAGHYREAVTISQGKHPLTIDASPGSVLSGADIWNTGWTSAGNNRWTRPWPYKWGMKPIPPGWDNWYWNHDGQGHLRDRLRRTEMLFVDDKPFHSRLKLEELQPGTFHVDEANGRLTVHLHSGQSLSSGHSHQVEVAVRLPVLRITRPDVSIRGLTIEKGRGGVQDIGVLADGADRLLLEGVTVRHHGYAGLGMYYGKDVVVRGSTFSDNGVSGPGAWRSSNLLYEDVSILRNNWRGWDASHQGWDSVHKWMGLRKATARRVQTAENFGHGFWLDVNNRDVVIDQMSSTRNRRYGIYLELNDGPISVQNSTFCNNVMAGVVDARSNNVRLTGNRLFGNGYQLHFTGQMQSTSIKPWDSSVSYQGATDNWVVEKNTFRGRGSGEWLVWFQNPNMYEHFHANATLRDNQWWHDRSAPYMVPREYGGAVDFAGWVQRMNTKANPNSPNNEAGTIWKDSGTASCP